MKDEAKVPMVGNVCNVEGKRLPPPANPAPMNWSEFRTDPKTWDSKVPQLHQSRGGRPLVVLMGWAGATPDQIAHVVHFWQDQGCAVLRMQANPWSMYNPAAYKADFETYYQHLRTYIMPNKGFLVHAMSELGAYCLARVMMVDKQSKRDLFGFCRGVVFDSGPVLVAPQHMGWLDVPKLSEAAGIMTAAEQHVPLTPMVNLVWTPIYLLALMFLTLYHRAARLDTAAKMLDVLTKGLAETRVLLLFSECDTFASPEDIRRFKNAVRSTKTRTTVTDTEHCCHLLDAPEVAKPALQEFLRKCEDD